MGYTVYWDTKFTQEDWEEVNDILFNEASKFKDHPKLQYEITILTKGQELDYGYHKYIVPDFDHGKVCVNSEGCETISFTNPKKEQDYLLSKGEKDTGRRFDFCKTQFGDYPLHQTLALFSILRKIELHIMNKYQCEKVYEKYRQIENETNLLWEKQRPLEYNRNRTEEEESIYQDLEKQQVKLNKKLKNVFKNCPSYIRISDDSDAYKDYIKGDIITAVHNIGGDIKAMDGMIKGIGALFTSMGFEGEHGGELRENLEALLDKEFVELLTSG
jgi:hypothetical protein